MESHNEHIAAEYELLHKYLDGLGVPRSDDGGAVYSLVGRVNVMTAQPSTDERLIVMQDIIVSLAEQLTSAEMECTRLHARLAAAGMVDKRDAERYRWLRNAGWIDDSIMESQRIKEGVSETMDAAIDAAMSQDQKGG